MGYVLCPGAPEGSIGSGLWFKMSQKTGPRLTDWLGKLGRNNANPIKYILTDRLKISKCIWTSPLENGTYRISV